MESPVLDHAIKVRKPYTITKQRERWTDEEHNKFLEALKLHGRAWRRIEEHIGTKTAVQIRSHAQKFFSKVVRESGGDSPSTVKTIEIPPPRPKRKPIHPYPRKLGHSLSNKAIPSSEQSDGSSSVSEQENKSPTSVLSVVGSGVFGPSLSNLPSSYASPSSSAAGPVPVGTLLSEQENECQSASTSAEKDNRSPLPNPVPPGMTLQDISDQWRIHMYPRWGDRPTWDFGKKITDAGRRGRAPPRRPLGVYLNVGAFLASGLGRRQKLRKKELNLDAGDNIPAKEASSTEAQTTSLKLFGRTVLVADVQKSSTGSIVQRQESLPAIETERHQRNIGLDLQFPARPSLQNTAEVEFSAGRPSHQNTAEVEFSAGEARSQWHPWTGGMPPMLYCLPSHGNIMDPAQASIIPLPWWAFYNGLPFPVMSPQGIALQEEVMTSCREDTKDGDMQNEGSLTGSNGASISEVEMREKSGETTESLHTENSNSEAAAPALRLRTSGASAFTRLKASSKKSARGFMPYRRCVAESEAEHREMASDKEDGQGMQLCL